MERGIGGRVLIIIILVVLVAAVYLTFFHHPKCSNITCWEEKLISCDKATYINNPQDVVWKYTIEGEKEGKCEVRVETIEIKSGLKSAEVLEGKEMTCFLPLGVITDPEANTNVCYGRLKEEMQGLIIQKLHEYIVQNVGQIEDALNSISGVTSTETVDVTVGTNSSS